MSIRLRLTLLYTAVLAVTLVLLGGVLYFWTAHSLGQEIDRSLNARASRDDYNALVRFSRGPGERATRPAAPAAAPAATPAGGSGDQGDSRPLPFNPVRLFSTLADRLGDPTILLQVDDGSGQVLYSSSNLVENGQKLPQPRSLKRHLETVSVNRVDLRVLTVPVAFDSSRPVATGVTVTSPLVVLLARPLVDTDNTLGHMRFILLLGSALCLAAAAGAGWLLARGALRPIDRLTSQAQGIGRKQDFKRRIEYSGPEDEVGRLASTFNGMLDGLDSAHEQQLRALQAQRRFVADASHELRTPLTTIRGNVELLALESDSASPDHREALADIASEAERMSRLVANLLALARADSGLHITRRPVEVQPVVAEVVQKAPRLGDHVDLRLEGAVDARVLADRDYLLQLILILVDNALKYTPPGGSVTVSPSLQQGTLRIAVRDTGPGIAHAEQARIFDRFYRADPSRHGEGTGLGLSIAAWIVRELGGRIELQSEPGAGSTFTIVLPAEGSALTASGPDGVLVAGG